MAGGGEAYEIRSAAEKKDLTIDEYKVRPVHAHRPLHVRARKIDIRAQITCASSLSHAQALHPTYYYDMPSAPTCGDYVQYPFKRYGAYYRRLTGNFGLPFVIMLASAYGGVKGALYSFLTSGLLPFFQKTLGVSGSRYQAYSTVALSPWSMKAFIGMVSDCMPIMGYYKIPYLVMASVFATAAFYLICFMPIEADSAQLAAALFFFGHLGACVCVLSRTLARSHART